MLLGSTCTFTGKLACADELFHSQTTGAAVECRYALNDCDRLCVMAPACKKPRRFLEFENEKAEGPEDESASAKSEEKVPPAHVLRAGTGRRSGSLGAREISDERPGNLKGVRV
ncbi:hypothetical protein PHLCEN_2v13669 [Hermanssonia centrifuga]|uniref:Uncharacterized protein n=1 Tax=Hermanssonia centrifuga TaxID=98765 RepID=A0A2R6NDV4_9APHY|nr:hypothetical protein PHLCEN_2v13669 [Hermanssonia centrifuga]